MGGDIVTFGEHIRCLRKDTMLSLREVAERIGIDSSLLGKIERNDRQPTREQIKLIAEFFKLDEKTLVKELISDQIAYKIIEEADIETLKIAEMKIHYLKSKR